MTYNKEFLQKESLELIEFVKTFFKNPVEQIKHLPDWPWSKIIVFQCLFTAICGACAGLAERKVSNAIFGIISNPIVTLIMVSASTLFFSLFFKVFAHADLSWRKLFTLIVLANLPNFVFSIAAGYVPLIIMVGLLFTAFLLYVGFVHIFQLDRKLVQKLMVGLYVVFSVTWIINQINFDKYSRSFQEDEEKAPKVHLNQ